MNLFLCTNLSAQFFLSLSISFTSSDASLFFSWQIYVMKPSISSMDRYIISFIYHVYILNMLFSNSAGFFGNCTVWTVKKKKKFSCCCFVSFTWELKLQIEHYCHLLGVWYTQHPSSLEYLSKHCCLRKPLWIIGGLSADCKRGA